jgi:hypothetical protein
MTDGLDLMCFVMVGGKYPKVEFDVHGSLDLVPEAMDSE